MCCYRKRLEIVQRRLPRESLREKRPKRSLNLDGINSWLYRSFDVSSHLLTSELNSVTHKDEKFEF